MQCSDEQQQLNMETDVSVNIQNEQYYYGKYWVFGKFRTNQYLCAIGPHWWVFLIGISILLFITYMIFSPIWSKLHITEKIIFYLLFTFMFTSYVLTFLSNPGIYPVLKNQQLTDEENNQDESKYRCQACKTPKRIRAYHCFDCDICIYGLDHHCVWTGKCIGKNNLKLFYTFMASVPLFFTYVILLSLMMSLDQQNFRNLRVYFFNIFFFNFIQNFYQIKTHNPQPKSINVPPQGITFLNQQSPYKV